MLRHKVITFHHGNGAMVTLRRWCNGDWRSLRFSAPWECKVPRIVARIRGCVVSAGRESSSENESGGPGNLRDGNCWTTIAETQEEHLWNLNLRRRRDDYDGANGDSASAGVVQSASSSCCTSPDGSSSLGVVCGTDDGNLGRIHRS